MGGKPKFAACSSLVEEYMQRSGQYSTVKAETFASEDKLLQAIEATRKKGVVRVALFEPSGKLLTSEELAAGLQQAGVDGVQHMLFCIGPADGWSEAALRAATQLISFGRITLPHELARVVAAEQIYRALSINAGHPYHGGH